MRGKERFFGAAGLFFGCWSIGLVGLSAWLRDVEPSLPEPPPPPTVVETAAVSKSPWLVIPDRVGRGDTLASVLQRNGFSPGDVHAIAEALTPHFDVRHLRAGDEVEIRYASDGGLESLRVHHGRLESYQLESRGSGWRAEPMSIELDRLDIVRAGELRGSLFASLERMGETPALVVAFAEIFQWDFDFHTQSREGDRFSLVVEKLFRNGEFVGYGDLRAARYVAREADLAAFLYETADGNRGYYDRDGKSMRKAFLRAPLRFNRISSRFSYSRLHPIHKRRMPHLGVDYAAPHGTPVHSVASGVVAGISRGGGSGNMVTIRHSMGYQSKYLHLSRFAKGLKVGRRVQQKEVIGYVGATGAATGPHLDFRLYRHGKVVNPLKQIYPPGPPVPEDALPDYLKKMASLSERLETPSLVAAVAD